MNYDEIKAVNWSALKHMAVSPLMYRWRLGHPEPKKPAFVFGGAVHCAVLEPERFNERYALCEVVRNGKHEAYKEWLAEHPGAEPLTADEMARVKQCAEAVLGDRVARALLRGGRREEPITWIDVATGIACKGRVDYIRPDFLLELKTAHDPEPDKFTRAATSFGYLAQTAFYHDGAIVNRLIDGYDTPSIIAVQGKGPYDVVSFRLTRDALGYGRAFYQSLLKRLLQCTEADYWPGCAPELQALGVSRWATDPFSVENDEEF